MGKKIMKKAAIYIRVSTLEQANEGYSLDAQERALRRWCEDHDYEPVLYKDCGISAKDLEHRPDMLRMLADTQNNEFSAIAVWALSRLTRCVRDLYDVWEMLSKHDTALCSITEYFDTSTPVGRAMMGMLGIFAQMEREYTSERVKAAMEERAKKGLPISSEILGYKRINGEYAVCEAEANQVRMIYRMFVETQCIRTVALELERLGYKGKRGCVMKEESVSGVLSRPFYCGYITYKGIMVAKGHHEPIIPIDEYNLVQDILLANGAKYGKTRKYPLQKLETADAQPF